MIQKGNIMQINSNVNTKSNLPAYRNEKNAKASGSSFDLKTIYFSNETVNEGKKSETTDVQELYMVNSANSKLVGTKSMGNAIPVRTDGLEVWYDGEKMEWSATDEKYTDEKTEIEQNRCATALAGHRAAILFTSNLENRFAPRQLTKLEFSLEVF